jgi:hypothetical protein
MQIKPYWSDVFSTWVFDDEATGLHQEPFIEGIPLLISELVASIQDAQRGFLLSFAAEPFPSYQRRLCCVREQDGGHWYEIDDGTDREGWLCPALFHYFDAAPPCIYVQAEALQG